MDYKPMVAPPIGDCTTPDGSMHPAFDHEGKVGGGHRRVSREARMICSSCPVLAECRDWAARFEDWSTVTVAGWTASSQQPSAPPWSDLVGLRRHAFLRVVDGRVMVDSWGVDSWSA